MRSGNLTEVLSASSPTPPPGVRLVEGSPVVEDAGSRGAGGLRSQCEPERPGKAPFCLLAEPFARLAPKEYQGSHRREMAAYHTPWKANQWPSLRNPGRQLPSPLAPARDSRKERDIWPMP